MKVAWDDEDVQESLGIGSISIYERLPPESANVPKKDPIGFIHFPDRTAEKRTRRGRRKAETQ